jgi:hypothetical protein
MRKVVAALAFAAVLGCSSSGLVDPNSMSGNYTLSSVAGAPLPYLVGEGPPRTTLTGGTLTLTTTGKWSESRAYQQTDAGRTTTVTETDAGSWLRSGTAGIVLVSVTGATAYSGSWTGLALRLTRAGGFSGNTPLYVYAK